MLVKVGHLALLDYSNETKDRSQLSKTDKNGYVGYIENFMILSAGYLLHVQATTA